MMKSLLFLVFAFTVQTAAAVCNPTIKSFESDSDEVGTELALQYVCSSQASSVCVYKGQGKVAFDGKLNGSNVDSLDLYRQFVTSTGVSEYAVVESSLIDSILEYRRIEFQLDKTSMQASLSYTAQGSDSFSGSSSRYETDLVVCTKQ